MIYEILHSSEIREVSISTKLNDKIGYFAEKDALIYKFTSKKEGSFNIEYYDEESKRSNSKKKFNLNEEYIISFKNAILLGKGIVQSRNNFFLDHYFNHLIYDSYEKQAHYKETAKEKLGLELLGEGKCFYNKLAVDVEIIKEPVFLLASLKDEAYSHFLWDTLPLIFYINQLKKELKKELKIILIGNKENYPQYKLDFFYALGLKESDFIYKDVKDSYICKNLIVGGILSVNNRIISKNGSDILRSLRKVNIVDSKKIRIAYFDRNDYRIGIRSIINEVQIKEKLVELGIDILTPGNMSLEDKQNIFLQYDLIIAQYGGGIQNHFLFKDNVRIILLQSNSFIRDILHFTQSLYRQKVISIYGKAKSKKINSNFTISIDTLMKVVQKEIKFLKTLKENN